jgi:protein-S-isoprenylcysteine O-methyltransferase Ste14
MKREMSIFGTGPRIFGAAAGYALVAGLCSAWQPELCIIRLIPYWAFAATGGLLLAIGLPMLAVGVRAMTLAFRSDQLATTGVFGLVRNPIYSAWIVFIIPGIVLLSRSWPLLLTPVVAYLAFKTVIRRETEYLDKRFGEAYRTYESCVNELFPWPKRSKN